MKLTDRPGDASAVAHVQCLEKRMLLSSAGSPLWVNAGGDWYTDTVARTFAPGDGLTGGRADRGEGAILETDDDPLFISHHVGSSFTYSAEVADGNYALWLQFAEPSATAEGERVFNVFVEGELVLDQYDIFADAGEASTAVAQAFDVAVTDGRLDLAFAAEVGEALVSAIVLIPTDVPEAAQPYSWLALDEMTRRIYSGSNLRQTGAQAVRNRRCPRRQIPT